MLAAGDVVHSEYCICFCDWQVVWIGRATGIIPMRRCVTACFAVVKRRFRFVITFTAKCIALACAVCRMFIGTRIILLYAVTFLLVLPVLFHDVRHSAFYFHMNKTALKELMNKANSQRILQARNYFALLNSTGFAGQHIVYSNSSSKEAITVALSIITVSRNRHYIDDYEPWYLTQSAWKLHSLLGKWRLRNQNIHVHLSICNVDPATDTYQEVQSLSKFMPVFTRFNETHFSLVNTLEKEKQDYVYCLNKSLQVHRDADYVFLVEDDALPTDDVFNVLQYVTHMHTEQSFVRGEFNSKPSDVAFVKFYHPERLLNFFSLQPERLSELFSYAALLSTLLTIAYAVACGLTTGNVDACWRKLFLYSLIVVLACGRSGISEWRRVASPLFYSYTPAPSCCTPAMLFPRRAAIHTVNYLNSSTCTSNFGKDSALDNMLVDTRMRAYLVQPSTFTHIGVYSSLREKIVDPLMV